jgi:SHS2 domain-containing protein
MPYEIIEHTADVGIRAVAPTLAGVFEEIASGLFEIMDCYRPEVAAREERQIDVTGADTGALLVAFIDELLFVQESDTSVFTKLTIVHIDEQHLRALVGLAPAVGDLGTAVKAATYHQLEVTGGGGEWRARVYLDV